jgi:hypothetical protein
MEPLLKKILIVILSAAVVAPTVIVLYHYMSVSDQASNPLSYVPENSTSVAEINYNGTSMYAFYASGSPVLMLENAESLLNVNTSSVTGISNTSSITSGLGISLSTWGTIHGFQIYRIRINETGFRTLNSKFPSFALAFLKPIEANLSVNLYAYNPFGFSFVIGSIDSLNHSISAYSGSANFVSRSAYFNNSSNLSFYVSGGNSSLFSSVTGNITMNSTQIFLNMESTKLYSMYNISKPQMNFTIFRAAWVDPLQLEITSKSGLADITGTASLNNATGAYENFFTAYFNP